MALEIEGRIVRRFGVQRGVSARGNWAKQEFLIEYQDGNYPTQVCMNVWGEDKVKDLERFSDGDQVRVSFRVSSREFNGKWYTDLRAWRIDPAGGNAGADPGQDAGARRRSYGKSAGADNAAPFAPAPTADDFTASLDEDEDLPF